MPRRIQIVSNPELPNHMGVRSLNSFYDCVHDAVQSNAYLHVRNRLLHRLNNPSMSTNINDPWVRLERFCIKQLPLGFRDIDVAGWDQCVNAMAASSSKAFDEYAMYVNALAFRYIKLHAALTEDWYFGRVQYWSD